MSTLLTIAERAGGRTLFDIENFVARESDRRRRRRRRRSERRRAEARDLAQAREACASALYVRAPRDRPRRRADGPAAANWKNGRMAQTVTPPRGMRDFLPAEKARRERVLGVIRERYRGARLRRDRDAGHRGRRAAARRPRRRQREARVQRAASAASTPTTLAAAAEPTTRSTSPTSACASTSPCRSPGSTRPTAPSCRRCSARSRSRRSGAPSARRRAATASSCSATSTSSARPGQRAEVELDHGDRSRRSTRSGSTAARIRINDRRILTGMLETLGFAADELAARAHHDRQARQDRRRRRRRRAARARGADSARRRARGVLRALDRLPTEWQPVRRAAIRKLLPDGRRPDAVVAELVALGDARRRAAAPASTRSSSTRSWCAAWATTPARSSRSRTRASTYSLGGGGRYDGMIGRFLGTDVPAVRLLDRLRADRRPGRARRRGGGRRGRPRARPGRAAAAGFCALKTELVAAGAPRAPRARTKNLERCSSAPRPTASRASRSSPDDAGCRGARVQAARLTASTAVGRSGSELDDRSRRPHALDWPAGTTVFSPPHHP